MDHTRAPIQHPRGRPPHVVAPDGELIPIPDRFFASDGSEVVIKQNARITALNDGPNYYEVVIDNPSAMSSDTRMVLAAAGTGTAGGFIQRDLQGFRRIIPFPITAPGLAVARLTALQIRLLARVAGTLAGVIVGVLTPNGMSRSIMARTGLQSRLAAEVLYIVEA